MASLLKPWGGRLYPKHLSMLADIAEKLGVSQAEFFRDTIEKKHKELFGKK